MFSPAKVIPRCILRLATALIFPLCLLAPAGAQELSWEQLNQKTLQLQQRGDYPQATVAATQALRAAEKAADPHGNQIGTSLINLAWLYSAQQQYEEAAVVARRSLEFWENHLGPEAPFVATCLTTLANLYIEQGRYALAQPLLERAHTLQAQAFGMNSLEVAATQVNFGRFYDKQYQFQTAQKLYASALKIQEKILPPAHPTVVATWRASALNLAHLDQFQEAETLYKRVLLATEKASGLESFDVAVSLQTLAGHYAERGQFTLAETLYRRALAIHEQRFGADSAPVAWSLYGLVRVNLGLRQFAKAESDYRRVLHILAGLQAPLALDQLPFFLNLEPEDFTPDQLVQAEPLLRLFFESVEKTQGPTSLNQVASLVKLAEVYRLQGQLTPSLALFQRALALEEMYLTSSHPGLALILNKLSALYQAQGQPTLALSAARRATDLYRSRLLAGGGGEVTVREAANNQSGFFNHLSLLSDNPTQAPADTVTEEAFQVIQLAQASGTTTALARMAARFATGNDALAVLVKRKQDAADRLLKQEAQQLAALAKPPRQRQAAQEQALGEDITRSGLDITALDAELSQRFPQYQALTRPEPVSVTQVQSLLKPGEAMLLYALGRHRSFLWVIKPEGADFRPLEAQAQEVSAKVATLLAEMEPDHDGRAQRVSLALLHDLYLRLFAVAKPQLAGVQHLMLVPMGALQSLPFGMLVASSPPAIRSSADYRQVDWLARHYALSVLPSASAIQALRQQAPATSAQEPFAGFGDPLLGESEAPARGKRPHIDVQGQPRDSGRHDMARSSAAAPPELADGASLREVPRLPETADELRVMAQALKANERSIWLQEQATETTVKRLDLTRYRTLAFATHGVMAGEIHGLSEAGLILTPPKVATADDDGYLSAGEIAGLKLNADWVILSACNTAAADGTPGAEGLSGLAKAFFYAGARSLFVSHWRVDSHATVPLTTGMLKEYERNPHQGKAQAHRLSMQALMDSPALAHPAYWAPFVVVGEGGAR